MAFIPKNNPNGLFIYSDIHRCKDGFLAINNLHIDANSSVRTIDFLKLPSEKKVKPSVVGIPVPSEPVSLMKSYRITGIRSDQSFRLTIKDDLLDIFLIIGDIQLDDEQAEYQIKSNNDTVEIKYYHSDLQFTDNLEDWLIELANLLELLPPTKVGLFIDTLRYIEKLRKIPPAPFHIDLLKTILSSHKIFFDVNQDTELESALNTIEEMYGSDIIQSLNKILEALQTNPEATLQEFTQANDEDLSHLVYLFLILEQENVITIVRPDEIKFT